MILEQPNDPAAERAVLAACLDSRLARDKARALIAGPDLYDPRHEAIWDAMSRLDRADRDVSAVSVMATLGSNRAAVELMPDIVTTLAADVNTAAELVRAWGIRRRLAGEADTLAKQAANLDANPAGLAAAAASRLAGIRDLGVPDTTTALTLGELLQGEDVAPDWVIPDLLERRDRLMLTGQEGLGKALDVTTPVPTPTGWRTMGDLQVGDEVFGPDGVPTRVVATSEVMTDRECFALTFSDGARIVADKEHLWLTETLKSREATAAAARRGPTLPRGTDQRHKRQHFPAVVTTGHIADTLHARNGHAVNHSVEVAEPLRYPAKELLIEPYALGVWLGDGTSRAARVTLHPDDREVMDRIATSSGWPVRKLKGRYAWAIGDGQGKGKTGRSTFSGCLRELGVMGDKHIPRDYLEASVPQRLALLQGLMDTDGTVLQQARGATVCEFSVTNERLARGAHELLLSLGIKVTWRSGPATVDGRTVGTRYRLSFQTELPAFWLRRKAERLTPMRTKRSRLRYINSCEPVASVPVRCIQVARADGLFVVGKECITTHNSALIRQIAIMAAAGMHPFRAERIKPVTVTMIDSENSESQVRRKVRPLVEWLRRMGAEDPSERVVIDCMKRMDLTTDKALAEVHHLLDATQPDIVVIGPLYRLVPRAINSDDDAAPLLAALDTIRDRAHSPVLLMEAHAGHATGSSGAREMRPRGSAALLGWPEFGFGLRLPNDGVKSYADFVPWRGQRDERAWPGGLKRDHDGSMRWLPVDPNDVAGAVA